MDIRKEIIFRFGLIYFVCVLFAGYMIVSLILIQTTNTDRWDEITKNLRNNTESIPAKRGSIYADDGKIIATSVPYYELRFDLAAPQVIKMYEKYSGQFIDEVTKFFNIPKSTFKSELDKAFQKKSRWFLLYPNKVNYNQLKELKSLDMLGNTYFGSGLNPIQESERVLPRGDIAKRTIGMLNKGVYGGIHGKVGYSGIEGMMEGYLAGEDGRALKKNLSGQWTKVSLFEPKDGLDIVTTINVTMQDYTENALRRQLEVSKADWGTAVIMEVSTGEIKAISNLGVADGQYIETYNYAIGHSSEPGSTFKLMSIIAALEHGKVDTSTIIDTGNGLWTYRGQNVRDSDYGRRSHGKISVRRIFELSSNVGVAKTIVNSFEGHEKDFMNRINSYGLNKQLGLGFAGEGVPKLKYPGDVTWWGPSLAWISYGYEIAITPLQTLTFYNAIANNGKMIKPSLVKEVRENGVLVRKFEPEILNPAICSKETIGKAQRLLKGVCENGTGKGLNNPYFPVAGKTGTAQIAYQDQGYSRGGARTYQASFVGYFPADDPKYTAIVIVVNPKGSYYGGSVAGPVFKELVDRTYSAFLEPHVETEEKIEKIPAIKSGFREKIGSVIADLKIPVDASKSDSDLVRISVQDEDIRISELSVISGQVPDVMGMGGRDALYILEQSGLKVKIKGVGKVSRQSLPAGNKIGKGQTIYLDLS